MSPTIYCTRNTRNCEQNSPDQISMRFAARSKTQSCQTSWYWAAVSDETAGPWWAATVAEKEPNATP
ncbi:MAG: hypothetical protein H0T92_23925 [Pyrinomonadaceae bacterium]|nr:hypothetical protein [Pyrinomonadaceae bacterium]